MSNTKKQIVIAGHTGFVGSKLVAELQLDKSLELVAISRSNGYDLLKSESLDKIHCDVIVNVAGLVGVNNSWNNPSSYYKNNPLITLNLLDLAQRCGASFFQISSYVYGVPEYLPIDELHLVHSYNPYTRSKIMSDDICRDYATYFNVPVTILRPFNIYGIGQSKDFLIPSILNSVKSKSHIYIQDLHARRDYLWVKDLVNAIILSIHKQKEGFRTYNLGSGVSRSALDIISIISRSLGDVNYSVNPEAKALLIQDCVCNNKLFVNDFDWTPQINLEEGIKCIIEESC